MSHPGVLAGLAPAEGVSFILSVVKIEERTQALCGRILENVAPDGRTRAVPVGRSTSRPLRRPAVGGPERWNSSPVRAVYFGTKDVLS
jgi:hypothetical protein